MSSISIGNGPAYLRRGPAVNKSLRNPDVGPSVEDRPADICECAFVGVSSESSLQLIQKLFIVF